MADITRYRGDTVPDELEVVQQNGAAFDLSGCTLVMTLNRRKNPADTTEQVYSIVGNITDYPGGVVEFTPTPEQADQVGSFYYDIELTDSLGRVQTLVLGKYTYIQDITKNS